MKTLLFAATLALMSNAFAATEVHKVKTGVTNEAIQVESKTLNSLIRGELAAVKTYETAIKKIESDKEKTKLVTIKENHQNAADKLKSYVPTENKDDVKSSGVWGTIANAYEGGAS